MVDIYAHRGFHLNEAENSLGAFVAAVAVGVTGVELDVRRTVDGVLVIHHDPLVDSLPIASTPYRELPVHVATLEQALDALRGVRVNVEIKNSHAPTEAPYDASGNLARQVVAQLQRANRINDCIISCFDLTTCRSAREFDHDLPVGWLFWDVDPLTAIVEACAAGLQALHPHFALVNGEFVEMARTKGLDVNVWTVNSAHDMTAMAALNVASIITDDPVLAQQILA